jgi:hypothetical protein
VKSIVGARAAGRKSREAGESYHLREPAVAYSAHVVGITGDIWPENTYFWNINP